MIKWSDIEEELQEDVGYREAFVNVFQKYKGQETDERDKYKRPIAVTVSSFARHFGISPKTFQDWVKPPAKKVPDTGSISKEARTAQRVDEAKSKEKKEAAKESSEVDAEEWMDFLEFVTSAATEISQARQRLDGFKATKKRREVAKEILDRIEEDKKAIDGKFSELSVKREEKAS